MPIETILVRFQDGLTTNLLVEEFHPVDFAAYQQEAGWTCYLGDDSEYFVSTYGVVYAQPSNEIVGEAPKLKAAADKLEAQMAEGMED